MQYKAARGNGDDVIVYVCAVHAKVEGAGVIVHTTVYTAGVKCAGENEGAADRGTIVRPTVRASTAYDKLDDVLHRDGSVAVGDAVRDDYDIVISSTGSIVPHRVIGVDAKHIDSRRLDPVGAQCPARTASP